MAASTFVPLDSQQLSYTYAQGATEALIQITEYFPDKLNAVDLTNEQKAFVLAALATTAKNIDSFVALLPAESVAAATEQLEEENRLNEAEYAELDIGKIVNVPQRAPAEAPPASTSMTEQREAAAAEAAPPPQVPPSP